MKKYLISIIIALIVSVSVTNAQEGSSNVSFKAQAQQSLQDKEYTKARYLFKRAYEAYARQGNYAEAIACGVKTNELYTRENLYQEAFDLCREMDAVITTGEEKLQKKMPELRFMLAKERLAMFSKLKNVERSKDQLVRLEESAGAIRTDSIKEELLYIKANYYYTFGPAELGVASYRKIINTYKQQGANEKVATCYQNMVSLAEKVNNAPLAVRTYKEYVAWNDSVAALSAANELAVVKKNYETSQQTLQERDSEISVQSYKIIGLCTLTAILIGGLIFVGGVLLRFISLTRKQKKNIEIANEHNDLKSQFIQNISAQMEPALNTLAQSAQQQKGEDSELMQVQIEALRGFSNDIQELSHLEHSLTEPYELTSTNVQTFCDEVIMKVKPFVQPGVEIVANAPKLQIKTNPEQLERILIHLLKNAAFYTENGKITLDFKKRGAHTHQFLVTDTGTGIPEELRENIFKPFTEVKDLTQGDGLGLPICSLIATKMNGTLTLDNGYTKGSRFVLELHA